MQEDSKYIVVEVLALVGSPLLTLYVRSLEDDSDVLVEIDGDNAIIPTDITLDEAREAIKLLASALYLERLRR